jgi:hypothetical protein
MAVRARAQDRWNAKTGGRRHKRGDRQGNLRDLLRRSGGKTGSGSTAPLDRRRVRPWMHGARRLLYSTGPSRHRKRLSPCRSSPLLRLSCPRRLEALGFRHLSQQDAGLRELAGTELLMNSASSPLCWSSSAFTSDTISRKPHGSLLDRFVDAVHPDPPAHYEVEQLTRLPE